MVTSKHGCVKVGKISELKRDWNLNEGSVNFEEEYEEDISLSSEGVYKVERLIDKRKIKVSQSSTERRHLSVHSRPATPSLVSMV